MTAGFLIIDDPWLIAQNPFLQAPSLDGLVAIWTDLSLKTRQALGTEYLPVRDTSHWLEAMLVGIHAPFMHVVNILIYAAAVVLLFVATKPAFNRVLPSLAAISLFALHPLHAESVAWLAGRKDVLALFFVAGALYAHTHRTKHSLWI